MKRIKTRMRHTGGAAPVAGALAVLLAAAVLCATPAARRAWAEEAKVRTWDTAMLKTIVWSRCGGEAVGLSAWKRSNVDGGERWVAANKIEGWDVRPFIVMYVIRVGHERKENANRLIIASALLTSGVMKQEGHEPPDLGPVMDKLTETAAAHPGQDAQQELGAYLLTMRKADPGNLWLFSIEPR